LIGAPGTDSATASVAERTASVIELPR